MNENAPRTASRILLAATRLWLPLVIAGIGVLLIVLGHASLSDQAGDNHAVESGSGVALLIVAIIVWMVNWMFRMSVQSNDEREIEEQAREYFDRHGHWPDEAP
jgi:uncharacterized membrane protein